MDEIFGLIASAIAKKLREANATVAEAERAQAEAQQRAILRSSGFDVPEPPRQPREKPGPRPSLATPKVAPLAIAPRSGPRDERPMAGASVGEQARHAADVATLDALFVAKPAESHAAAHGTPPLLAAFRGGAPLLAAFVLAEALAPPVALRRP
ncbi:MAG: hypothetical protein NVS2B8_20060 [Vulcanimicrobiaceae bacterium]